MRRLNPCNCRSLWCWLDRLTGCKSQSICDRHDDFITGGR